jgi:predicted ATPase
MISRIEVKHYRCLENIGIDLPQYAVLVGANGSGKTTLLDIPCLIGDCLKQRDITQAFVQMQQGRNARCTSLRELVFCNRGNDFFFAVVASLPEGVVKELIKDLPVAQKSQSYWPTMIRYELRLEIFNEKQLQVKNEYLFLFSEKNKPAHDRAFLYGERPRRGWRFIISREYGSKAVFYAKIQNKTKKRLATVEASMLALPQVQFESKENFPAAIWFYDLLIRGYIFYQPELRGLQSASPPGLADTLLPNAINLPHLALALQQNDPKRFKLWQEHIKTALPNIKSIELKEREDDHHVYFRIVYEGGYSVTSYGLSEGILKLLALTILPYLNTLPAIVFLEEPENAIHPQAIETILQSLSSAYHSQILISSHSPIVLANTKLSQIICARLNSDGASTIIHGTEHPNLKDWQGHIDIGTLFASGVFE